MLMVIFYIHLVMIKVEEIMLFWSLLMPLIQRYSKCRNKQRKEKSTDSYNLEIFIFWKLLSTKVI
jgi:hypothetical protein